MKHVFVILGLIGLLAFTGHSQTCEVLPRKVVVPPYPAVSLALKESGTVVVRVTVGEDGNILRAEAIEGPKWLSKNSELVAKVWKFSAVKPTETAGCKERSADLTFDYEVLPAGTPSGPETRSYFVLPFHITVQERLGSVTINPTGKSEGQ
ncbi:MAG: energy transducer TonB [Pyrinomonadaceae bacterium]|nr:energy transducer TonB [Pyrinomonadaceae bacterium]